VPTQTLFDTDEADSPAAKPKRAKSAPAPITCADMPGIAEPVAPGASALERWMVRDTLTKEVAAYQAGELPADELFRLLRGSLYVLTNAELVRVAKGLLLLLEATDGRRDDVHDYAP
jgi:hypothetical protein